jgi:hypothetical protein
LHNSSGSSGNISSSGSEGSSSKGNSSRQLLRAVATALEGPAAYLAVQFFLAVLSRLGG